MSTAPVPPGSETPTAAPRGADAALAGTALLTAAAIRDATL